MAPRHEGKIKNRDRNRLYYVKKSGEICSVPTKKKTAKKRKAKKGRRS